MNKEDYFIFDGNSPKILPENFRMIDFDHAKNLPIILSGIDKLKAIGSGQFNAVQLNYIVHQVHHPIIVIDLRNESHFFVNQYPISFRGPHNHANINLTSKQIMATEQKLLAQFTLNTPMIIYSRIKDIKSQRFTLIPHRIYIKNKYSEAQLVQSFGLTYYRWYVPDHQKPNQDTVKQFIQLMQQLPKNSYLYFHCRKGMGRTTTFLVMYDIYLNARTVSFHDIIKRQAILGGKNLAVFPDIHSSKYQDAVNRYHFLQQFYQKYHHG